MKPVTRRVFAVSEVIFIIFAPALLHGLPQAIASVALLFLK